MICPVCKNPATFGPNELFYGRRYVSNAGSYMAYFCLKDRTYVGVHSNNPDKPLGSMADTATRQWRMKAHRAIDPYWQTGKMERSTVYKKLKMLLGREVHVGGASIELCKSIIFASNDLMLSKERIRTLKDMA